MEVSAWGNAVGGWQRKSIWQPLHSGKSMLLQSSLPLAEREMPRGWLHLMRVPLRCVICLHVAGMCSLPVYVSHTTPCCLSAYALSFFYCASLQKYPLFSPVTSRAGLVEQGGKPFNSLPVQVSKTFSLIPCPNQSKLFHYSGSWHAILSHHHSCHNLELFSCVQ